MSELFKPRKHLHHTPPDWIDDSEIYFLTINGFPRGLNHFANDQVGPVILKSAKFHHKKNNWYCRLLMIMPDHLHLLVAVPKDTSMKQFVISWKGFISKQTKIMWQRDFFDHRIRNWESMDAKADYIRQNPVRAKLVENWQDWKWEWDNK